MSEKTSNDTVAQAKKAGKKKTFARLQALASADGIQKRKTTKVYGNNPIQFPIFMTEIPQGTGRNKLRGRRLRLRCGCCSQSVVIYPAEDPVNHTESDAIEINGVSGSVSQWREILLPVLGIKYPSPIGTDEAVSAKLKKVGMLPYIAHKTLPGTLASWLDSHGNVICCKKSLHELRQDPVNRRRLKPAARFRSAPRKKMHFYNTVGHTTPTARWLFSQFGTFDNARRAVVNPLQVLYNALSAGPTWWPRFVNGETELGSEQNILIDFDPSNITFVFMNIKWKKADGCGSELLHIKEKIYAGDSALPSKEILVFGRKVGY